MPMLSEIVSEFIEEKRHQGGSARHAMQGAAFGEILKGILEEQGLLGIEVVATQEYRQALEAAVQALRGSQFGGYNHNYSFQNLRQQANWPNEMKRFITMTQNAQYHAQAGSHQASFESLFDNISQGVVEPILQAIDRHPEWLNQATSAPHRSNLLIAALFELRQPGIGREKRDELLRFLEQVIANHGQRLNLGFRDAGGNTVLHRIFWYAIQVIDEETARHLADLGRKMLGLIRHSESYSAIMGMKNKQRSVLRLEGETFIDNIYFSSLPLSEAKIRNRDYLHAILAPVLNPQQKPSIENKKDAIVSFNNKSFIEHLEEIFVDAVTFDVMKKPMTLVGTGHTLDKTTWDRIASTTKRNPLTNKPIAPGQFLEVNPILEDVIKLFEQYKEDEAKLASEMKAYFSRFNGDIEVEKAGYDALILKDVLHLTYSYFNQPQEAQESSASSSSLNAPLVDSNPKSIKIEKVFAFNGIQGGAQGVQPQIHVPKEIMDEFKTLISGTGILGSRFFNPYTSKEESFPQNPEHLTPRHLELLARNEAVNVTGDMKTALYDGLLTADQIATLRALVKAALITGTVEVTHKGGYPQGQNPRVALGSPEKTILVDQAGLQWQNDFRNTGGLFFHPNNLQNPMLPVGYRAWQEKTHQALYGSAFPVLNPQLSVQVTWNGVTGQLDLAGVSKAIEVEFLQAIDAVATQGRLTLAPQDKINFKYLKAGMGFFASGLNSGQSSGLATSSLELARLTGINCALERIVKLPFAQRQALLGQIARIELPFSQQGNDFRFAASLGNIKLQLATLGLVWGGDGFVDALTPTPGYVNAVTNCGDPHAFIGNEGGYSSVDAMIASNCPKSGLLNPGANADIGSRLSLNANAFLGSNPQASNFVAQSSAVDASNEEILKAIIRKYARGLNRGEWRLLANASQTIEIGVGNGTNKPSIATARYSIMIDEQGLLSVFDKQTKQSLAQGASRTVAINEVLPLVPQAYRLDPAVLQPQASISNAPQGFFNASNAPSANLGPNHLPEIGPR